VYVIQSFMHWLGFGLCHQLPERSFFGGGVQLPVCARDTGIYIGFCVALVVIWLLHRPERPREFPTTWGWVAFTLMVGSMALDGGTQLIGLRSSTNELRLITGLLCGFAIAMLMAPMLNDSVWRLSNNRRVLDPAWRLGVFVAVVPVVYVVVWWGAPALGIGYPVLAAAAVIATLVSVNMVMVCLTPWFDRKAARLIDAWPAALVALALTFAEVWLAGLLRLGLVALVTRAS
jgi:uncharacterized membrane protein